MLSYNSNNLNEFNIINNTFFQVQVSILKKLFHYLN